MKRTRQNSKPRKISEKLSLLNFRYRFLGTFRSCLQTHNCQNVIRFSFFSVSMLSSSLPFQTRFIFASVAALSLILASGCQSIHDKKEVTVEILHTNDMHSHFAGSKNGSACITESDCEGGYGRVAKYVKEVKERNPPVFNTRTARRGH